MYVLTATAPADGSGGALRFSEPGQRTRIVGNGSATTVLDARGLGDRALDILENAVVELEGVTILAGEIEGNGAGIRNDGDLVLRDMEIALGKASEGGAVFNSGIAELDRVRLVGNAALRGGG